MVSSREYLKKEIDLIDKKVEDVKAELRLSIRRLLFLRKRETTRSTCCGH